MSYFYPQKKPIYYFVSIMAIAAYLRVSQPSAKTSITSAMQSVSTAKHMGSRSATWLPTPKAASYPGEIVIWPA